MTPHFFKHAVVPIPARKIYQSPDKAEFKVDIEIQTCVHGYLARDKKQPVSLIVLAVQLVCVSKEGSFDRFHLDLTFNDKDEAASAEPFILSTAPFHTEERENPKSVEIHRTEKDEVKRSTDATANAGAGLAPNTSVGATVKSGQAKTHSSETSSTYTQNYFGKGSSSTRDEPSGRRSGVWWNVKKSSQKDTKDDSGIHSNYVFAVLVRRNDKTTPFEARMHLLSETSKPRKKTKIQEVFTRRKSTRPPIVHRLSPGWIMKHESMGELEPIVFDPKVKLEGMVGDIDRKMLERYTNHDELARLTQRKLW